MTAAKPLVSVIMPVFNGEEFLEDAIHHVKAQGYSNMEIIIVDDGSTDSTALIAAKFKDSIRYIHQANQGPSAARNAGIRAATGEFIAFLDVDDLWSENTFHVRLRYLMEYPSLELVIGRIQIMKRFPNQNGKAVFEEIYGPFMSIVVGSMLYRRSVFDKVGLFNPALRYGEDLEWYMRAKGIGITAAGISDICLYYRLHGKNLTTGKNIYELNVAKVLKMSLDFRRQYGMQDQQLPPIPDIKEFIANQAQENGSRLI